MLDVWSRALLERIDGEPFGLRGSRLADELVGREALEGLEPAREVVGCEKVSEMGAELVVALVVEALDGGVLDSPVHPLDLAVGPWMPGLGGAVLDVVPGAGGRCRGVADSDAVTSASDAGSSAEVRRGSRPAVAACACERRR